MAKKLKWENTSRLSANKVLKGEDFFISYASGAGLACLGPFMSSENAADETALNVDGIYYILNGDFRKEYEAVFAKGKRACLEVYNSNKENYRSCWSED